MEMIKRYSSYIPLGTAVVLLIVIFGTIYAVAQHTLRAEANWPQVQIAEDGAAHLNNNLTPQSLVGTSIDISKSLATFTNVYDLTGRVVIGAGFLDGQVAVPPKGVLTASNNDIYHAVTWQPKAGVRIAAVVVKAKNYYVLSGRSLVEVEKNESQAMSLTLIGLFISLATLGGAVWAKQYVRPAKHETRVHHE